MTHRVAKQEPGIIGNILQLIITSGQLSFYTNIPVSKNVAELKDLINKLVLHEEIDIKVNEQAIASELSNINTLLCRIYVIHTK